MALESLLWLVFPSNLGMFRPLYTQMQLEPVKVLCVEKGDQRAVQCVRRGEQNPR